MAIEAPAQKKSVLPTIIAIGALVALASAASQGGSDEGQADNPQPTPSPCTADQPGAGINIQKQPKSVRNRASVHHPREYVLTARWCNTAVGVRVEWITDGKHDPPPGEYPYRDGTAEEVVTSYGGRVGLIVSPVYPEGNTGYIECFIKPKYNGRDLVPPRQLVQNFSPRRNTGASCFIGS